MNIYDLIFMACLSIGQGANCKQDMLQCVLKKRDAEIKAFLQTNTKDLKPEQFLNAQPQPKWDEWVLDCRREQVVKLNKRPVTK